MAVALEQFVKQLEDSGIMPPAKLKSFQEKLPPERRPKDAQGLARELVRQKKLTKYQAQEVYSGKARNLVLGNYIIMDKIGSGGMGDVFKAQHKVMDRIVAIKVLPPSVTKDTNALQRFKREAKAAAKLFHPNIVTAFDADQASDVSFLVMEFVDGGDLSALVKKDGPLPVDKALDCVLQAARGLEFAHKKGVVHRDIKPGNLLLDADGTVKILDMGLARLEGGPEMSTSEADLTGTGTIMGTVDYMAPEQAVNTKLADARADIYSLGCTLFFLVSARVPFEGKTMVDKVLAHRSKPVPALSQYRNDVPADLAAVFQRMVAKKIEDRYQSMTEVIAALERCQALKASGTDLPMPASPVAAAPAPAAASSAPAMAMNWPPAHGEDDASELSIALSNRPLRSVLASMPLPSSPAPAPTPTQAEPAAGKNRTVVIAIAVAATVGVIALVIAIVLLLR
jgi:serine/threonine protein kinase